MGIVRVSLTVALATDQCCNIELGEYFEVLTLKGEFNLYASNARLCNH